MTTGIPWRRGRRGRGRGPAVCPPMLRGGDGKKAGSRSDGEDGGGGDGGDGGVSVNVRWSWDQRPP